MDKKLKLYQVTYESDESDEGEMYMWILAYSNKEARKVCRDDWCVESIISCILWKKWLKHITTTTAGHITPDEWLRCWLYYST